MNSVAFELVLQRWGLKSDLSLKDLAQLAVCSKDVKSKVSHMEKVCSTSVRTHITYPFPVRNNPCSSEELCLVLRNACLSGGWYL